MYEMTIRLKADGTVRLYEQIYAHIKKEIQEGRLLFGERLPSARFLADYLQISRSTVDYAYGQLLAEGYIEAVPRKGYFVCSMEELFQLKGQEAQSRPVLARPAPLSPKEEEKGILFDFSPHEIDMSGFPFSVWKKLTKQILTCANSDLFARGEAQGDYGLRLSISRYLHASRGVNCAPEQLIVGAGNDYLLMLLEKILGQRVRIAMDNPTYQRSYGIFRSFAYDIVALEMDESGMRAQDLEREKVQAAYVMPSHQFPTGLVMPIRRRLELLKWAAKAPERYLIEDDYDSEFRFRGKPIPALQASDELGKVIYLGSFSKAIAPAIRISFMVLPPPLLEAYRASCAFYSCTVSRIDQSILNEFIKNGYFERHLNKMRKIYKAKHELLLEELAPFQKKFQVSGENAGLHLVLTARESREEGELIRLAAGQGVRVYGMSQGTQKPSAKSASVLLGFGGLTGGQIGEGLKRLKKAWDI